VQQRSVGGGGCPGFGLRRLVFRAQTNGQQVRLPQLQGIRDDFQPVVKHAAGVGVVVTFRCGELLDEFGVAI